MKIQKHIVTTEEKDIQIEEITLLSKEEYLAAKDNIPLIDDWWWLRSPGPCRTNVARVYHDRSVYYCSVDYPNVYVRPALRILNPESSNFCIRDKFEMAGYTWTVVLEEEKDCIALCNTSVGEIYFRDNWTANDANKYETSDVKKWLENWAKAHEIKVER